MAIGRISGPMLYNNLERQGVDLAFESNILYLDVTNRRIGANTETPNAELQVVGTANIGNITIVGNTISVANGLLDLGPVANVSIAGGSANYVLSTDGAGTLSWNEISSLDNEFGNLKLSNNTIEVTVADGNLILMANGAGAVTTANTVYAANFVTTGTSGNISGVDYLLTANIIATSNIAAQYFVGQFAGQLLTNAQPNLTSVGTLSNLAVSGYGNIGNISITDQTIAGVNLDTDIVIAPAGMGNIDANGTVITNLGTPIGTTDAVNKSYVDGLVSAVALASIGADDSFVTVFDDGMAPGNVVITTDAQDTAWFTKLGANIQNIAFHGNAIYSTTTDIVIGANILDPNNIIRMSSVSAMNIPIGTSIQRPPAPEAGYFRYNTDSVTIEWYTGTTWVSGSKAISYQTIAPDGVAATFSLNQASPAAGMLVNINGTVQQPGTAYTVNLLETEIIFAEIPLVTDIIEIRYLASAVVAAPYYGGDVGSAVHILDTTDHALTVNGGTSIAGNIIVGGNVNVAATSGTPINSTTPASWLKVHVGGLEYYMPLYQ